MVSARVGSSLQVMRLGVGLLSAMGLLLVVGAVACDGGDRGPADADDGRTDQGEGSFESVAGRFSLLETIAGRGLVSDKEVNGWLAVYEGGPARAAELSRPHMAMADAAGNVYVADKDAHAVRRIDAEGAITTVAGTNEAGDDGDAPGPGPARRLSSPNGLWVREDGVVYILDLGNGKVRRLSSDGTLTTLFRVAGGLQTGRGLWVDATEREAFVASGDRVLRWTPSGGVETWATGFVGLGNLGVSPGGELVVTDRDANRVLGVRGGGRTEVLAGTGTCEGGADRGRALEVPLCGVRAVAFDAGGGYFLGTHEGSQVWYVDPQGLARVLVDGARDAHRGDGQPLSAPGEKVSEVRGLSIAPSGDLLIVESDRGYVRVVRHR